MQNRAMYPETIAPPQGAYAHAVEIADGARVTHIAGQVGVDTEGNLPADFRAQAENAWSNLVSILEHNSMRVKDLVKVTHFITDPANLPAYQDVRAKYLGEERPASTLLIVAGLASPDMLIEVEAVAAISDQ